MYIHKNPKLLPVKWAKTSIAILLQHPHNLNVQKPVLTTSPDSMQHFEQRATYILDPHFPSFTLVVSPNVQLFNNVSNLCHLTTRALRVFASSIRFIK